MLTVAFDLDDTLITDLDERYKWFGTKVRLIPGALDTLRWCRDQGYRVILYSMGDLRSRLRRLEAAGIPRELFDGGIFAVPDKNPNMFETVLGYYQRQGGLIMVGDSWKRDVAVSLGRSFATVWVQGSRILGVDGTPADPENYPVWVIPTVAELPAIMPQVLADPYRGFDRAGWENYWWNTFGRSKSRIYLDPSVATGVATTKPTGQMTLDQWAAWASGASLADQVPADPADEPFIWDGLLDQEPPQGEDQDLEDFVWDEEDLVDDSQDEEDKAPWDEDEDLADGKAAAD